MTDPHPPAAGSGECPPYEPLNLDTPCEMLYVAMNRLPGINTTSSCCGHGKEPFRMFFRADSLESLPALLYHIVPCHIGFRWNCFVATDCAKSPVTFCLESQAVGEEAYRQSEQIAMALIREVMPDEE